MEELLRLYKFYSASACLIRVILTTRTDVSDASNKVVGLAEDVDAGPLDDVPEANGAVVGGRGGDRTVELNPGHASVVAGQGQYHIADVYVPDDDPRILHAGRRARVNSWRVLVCKMHCILPRIR